MHVSKVVCWYLVLDDVLWEIEDVSNFFSRGWGCVHIHVYTLSPNNRPARDKSILTKCKSKVQFLIKHHFGRY